MSKNILIVDDSSMMRLAVRTALVEAGYTVVEATDGVVGISKLQGDIKIDLIVCDVNMPNMDGITFVRKYKEDPKLKFIPVLMLTTEEGQERKEQGKEAGVRAWMIKPFNKTTLLNAVSKLLSV